MSKFRSLWLYSIVSWLRLDGGMSDLEWWYCTILASLPFLHRYFKKVMRAKDLLQLGFTYINQKLKTKKKKDNPFSEYKLKLFRLTYLFLYIDHESLSRHLLRQKHHRHDRHHLHDHHDHHQRIAIYSTAACFAWYDGAEEDANLGKKFRAFKRASSV